jgi:ribosomal protein S18 acetylase RimI-like enzyme
MPVQRLRRLDAPVALSLYDRLMMDALSCAYSRSECDALERDHPGLVVQREANVLGAISHGDAIVFPYAFESISDFQDYFEPMFEELLPRARKAYDAGLVRFRLTHGPSRPGIEATLKRLAFTPGKSWFQFSLAKGAPSPKIPAPKGITITEGSIADLDETVSIDHEAFPNTPITRAGMNEMIEADGRLWVARQKGRPVGFALYDHMDAGQGYLRTLAVREEVRGLGIGGALTVRTAKTVFAEGATRLDLRTNDDNGAAIRLYAYLGFKHVGSGRDYERPADPKVVDRMRKQSEGTFIKFGGWR